MRSHTKVKKNKILTNIFEIVLTLVLYIFPVFMIYLFSFGLQFVKSSFHLSLGKVRKFGKAQTLRVLQQLVLLLICLELDY